MISSIRRRSSHSTRLLFLLLLFFAVAANAQNSVVNAEYFFDNDPGAGSGVGVTLTPNTIVSASQLASVTILSPGRHVAYVRLKSQQGGWGAPVGTAVTISEPPTGESTITGAEYFFDTDPGIGLGQSLLLASGPTIAVQQSVSDLELARGRHTFHFRMKDGFGLWSAPLSCAFLVTDSIGYRFIKQAEYFFDRDPGQGKGNFLSVSGSLSFQNLAKTVSTSGLSGSSHRLFIRFLDDKVRWGAPIGVSFRGMKSTYVADAEFFIDSPGLPGTGKSMSALDSLFDSPSEYALAQVDTSSTHAGHHTVFVRVQSSDGRWSSITKDSLFFNKALTIVESDSVNIPKMFNLSQNYPNPFNPTTAISYKIAVNTLVTLKVYDILGREIKTLVNERQTAGAHSVTFDASPIASGVYFYRLQAGSYIDTKKLLLLK
jgi:Secretion system C-terminal sorting domain